MFGVFAKGGWGILRTYSKTTNYSISDISNARLQRKQVLRQTPMLDLVLQEFNQVPCDGARGIVLGLVGLRLIGIIGFDDGNDLLRVNWDMGRADAVLGCHDEVGFAAGREVGHSDVVEAFEGGGGGIDFDDDLYFQYQHN